MKWRLAMVAVGIVLSALFQFVPFTTMGFEHPDSSAIVAFIFGAATLVIIAGLEK